MSERVVPWSVHGKLTESAALLARAKRSIAGLTSSMMKRPEQFCPGSFPVYLRYGQGAVVEDVDGNQYIDFVCGLGANSLGHGHPRVLEALGRAMTDGLLHSLPTPLEVELAELLLSVLPNAEEVRFFKTGADATSAAVRIARAQTGRSLLFTVGYNGWHDHFMFDTPGVPAALGALTRRFPLFYPHEEAALLDAIHAEPELAAVVLSAPYNRVLSADFLQELATACRERGALLILDEIVTGFRLSPSGLQGLTGVVPDLACYSKALAAGMPLSALTGRRVHMERLNELQVSTTFGGETLSLAVAIAAIECMRDSPYYDHIAALGRDLRAGVNELAERSSSPLRVIGYDSIPMFAFDPARPVPWNSAHAALMRPLQGELAQRGVLLRRDVNFLCGVHTPAQVAHALQVFEDAFKVLAVRSTP